jgi:hypothetical protein
MIKDGVVFQKGANTKKSHEAPKFIKAKGKASMASSVHSSHTCKNHAYIYILMLRMIVLFMMLHILIILCVMLFIRPMPWLLLLIHPFSNGRYRRNISHARPIHVPKTRDVSVGSSISYRAFDASYMLYWKSGRVVASLVGPKCKNGKTCIWMPKIYVTNLTGPNSSELRAAGQARWWK